MQSRSKNNIVDQLVIVQLYTTTLHNIIIVEDPLANPGGSGSSTIHNLWLFQGQGSHMRFQALRVSA
jgi:hypothetical protein